MRFASEAASENRRSLIRGAANLASGSAADKRSALPVLDGQRMEHGCRAGQEAKFTRPNCRDSAAPRTGPRISQKSEAGSDAFRLRFRFVPQPSPILRAVELAGSGTAP